MRAVWRIDTNTQIFRYMYTFIHLSKFKNLIFDSENTTNICFISLIFIAAHIAKLL